MLAVMRQPCVYLLASKRNGTLYCGVTMDLPARLEEHHRRVSPNSFTARYGVMQLVWFEDQPDMQTAIRREKRIKKYPRAWKINLIEAGNPEWRAVCPVTGVLAPPRGSTGQAG